MSPFALPLLALAVAAPPAADRWPAFRGDGTGTATVKQLPQAWSPTAGIAWKADLPGYGQSSPVVWKGRVFVTAVEGPQKETNHVVCLDAATGKRVWGKTFPASQPIKNTAYVSRAAPTPAVDADGLYVFFESGDLVSLTHAGDVRWQRSLVTEYGELKGNHGLSASVALSAAGVVVLIDHAGPSYLLTADRATGKNVWKVDRSERVSWSSPVVNADGSLVVVSSGGRVDGYDAKSGDRRWAHDGLTGNNIPSATVIGDRIVIGASEGQKTPDVAAVARSNRCLQLVEKEGKQDVEVAWQGKKVSTSMASPLVHRGLVYFVNRVGLVYCLDLKTGEEKYNARIDGSSWASPIGAGDHVYFFGKDGVTTIIKSGPAFEKVASNALWDDAGGKQAGGRGGFGATDPLVYGVAATEGALYFRTGTQLYCVRE